MHYHYNALHVYIIGEEFTYNMVQLTTAMSQVLKVNLLTTRKLTTQTRCLECQVQVEF